MSERATGLTVRGRMCDLQKRLFFGARARLPLETDRSPGNAASGFWKLSPTMWALFDPVLTERRPSVHRGAFLCARHRHSGQ